HSPLYGRYDEAVDRESAYEKITQQGFSTVESGDEKASADDVKKPEANAQEGGGLMGSLNEILFGTTGPRGGKKDGVVQTAAKSMARQVGSSLGRQILRGVLGSIMGGRK
ncbi:MAG: DUF853 domain-containing protein, partial [Enterobacterales bacterium]|nr:DUF853 domain-containing protein [Enterobacterales bacterium]MDN6450008.1 DUF853 domain-containing protein [Enterobacterales bacterium]